jgi:GT2 family glycosyltransferase
MSAAEEMNDAEPKPPDVTVMITTRNRISELVKTLENCRTLSGVTLEVLVVDDTSTDGTYEVVRDRFPEVQIVRNEVNKGSIASRNDILRRARGRYVICLDDDSRFVDAGACERVVARMDREPDMGIIAFQVIGPENPATMEPGGIVSGEWHCSSFANCAAAIRHSIFDQTGFLPEIFYHGYEEPDLALRAWDAGYRVVQWNDILVYHEFSWLNRNERRVHQRHARNEAVAVVMRYPALWVVPALLGKLAGQAVYAARRGWLLSEPRVWVEFLGKLPRAIRERRSVRRESIKIAVGLHRRHVVDGDEARRLGSLPWRDMLRGYVPGADGGRPQVSRPAATAISAAPGNHA